MTTTATSTAGLKTKSNAYEGMFLFSQGAASDMPRTIAHLKEVLDRGQAEVIAIKKWDERRFAYPIQNQKRGLYILVYFNADPLKVHEIERHCNLSETVMRHLIIRADHLSLDEMRTANAEEDLNLEALLRQAAQSKAEAEAKAAAESN